MPSNFIPRLSLVDHAVEHLRQGIRAGRWKTRLPGELKLAKELGVSRTTVVPAIARLVEEGLLARGGRRQPIAIVPQAKPDSASGGPKVLRVAILLMESFENINPTTQRTVMDIFGRLRGDGHTVDLVRLPAGCDAHKTGYLPRLLKENPADAWVVLFGTREILEWMVGQRVPVFALGGRWAGLPVASADTFDVAEGIRSITRRLLALGHRRIVFLSSHGSRKPVPERVISVFFEELTAAGLKPGEYNAPDWKETSQGLVTLLESLFRFTPPTALVCHNLRSTVGTLAFLTRAGLRVPADVSVATFAQPDAVADWVFPQVRPAYIQADEEAVCRAAREWVRGVALGRIDKNSVVGAGLFAEGDTLGPVKSDEGRPRQR